MFYRFYSNFDVLGIAAKFWYIVPNKFSWNAAEKACKFLKSYCQNLSVLSDLNIYVYRHPIGAWKGTTVG